jgi:hypothetical protein
VFRRDALLRFNRARFSRRRQRRIFTKYCEKKMFGCDLAMLQCIGFIGGIGHDPLHSSESGMMRGGETLHVSGLLRNPADSSLDKEGTSCYEGPPSPTNPGADVRLNPDVPDRVAA